MAHFPSGQPKAVADGDWPSGCVRSFSGNNPLTYSEAARSYLNYSRSPVFGSGPTSDLLALDGSRRLEVPLGGSRMLEIPLENCRTSKSIAEMLHCSTCICATKAGRQQAQIPAADQPSAVVQASRMLHIRPAFPENRQARPDRPAGSSLKGSIACGRWVTERHHAMHFIGCAQTCRSSGYSNETAKYPLEVLYQWDGAGPDVAQPFSVTVSTGSSVCLASQRASSSSAPWTSWPAPVLDKL